MDKRKVWKTVLESLKINLSSASFATWFAQTFVVQMRGVAKNRQIAEIGCPSSFVRNTIETRYYGLIKEALDQATGKSNDLVFVVKQGKKPAKKGEEPLFEVKKEKTGKSETIKKAGLRSDFNFDSFAVSSTNQMAHAAATAVAKTPGKAYNPLFLYGGVGVGKTHLMQAIAIAVLTRNPKAKVIYCTGEDFTNEIIDAIQTKATREFKQKYRSAKLLLIDDIQFIAGKTAVQEEFFHTFNALHRIGGQIILTSDRRPDEIAKLEDRLRSRFEGGLTIDIQKPNFELRTAIVLIKAQQKGVNVPMDAAQLIASNITSTRRLEGVLTRLISESKLKNEPITPSLASAILGHVNNVGVPRKLIKPREMMRAVASYFNLKLSELTGSRRTKPIVVPRQILMYLLRTELKVPLMEIGRLLGGRDHTTIMHGVDKITKLLPESEDLRVDISGIKQKAYG
jgi:chromosomal replication initiator protein